MAITVEDYLGTLAPSAEDKAEARRRAMGMAAAALIGGGPDRGQNIAQAMLLGQQGYDKSLEQMRRDRLARVETLTRATELEQQQRQREQSAAVAGALSGAARDMGGAPDAPSASPRERQRRIYLKTAEQLASQGHPEAAKFFDMATKLEEKPVVVGTDLVRPREGGGADVVYSAPKERKAPEGMQYVNGTLQEIPGYVAMKSKIAAAGRAPSEGAKPPAGYRVTADGNLTFIPGGPADPSIGQKASVPTEDERRSAGLAIRMDSALRALETRKNAAKPEVWPEMIRGATLGAGEAPANWATSADRQQVESAQLDALDAALTLATGAAYTKDQLQNLRKSYFPQLGDSKETVAFKEQKLSEIIQTARIRAGRQAPEIDKFNANREPQEKPLTRIKNDAEFRALPSGAVFIDPEGNKRRKP